MKSKLLRFCLVGLLTASFLGLRGAEMSRADSYAVGQTAPEIVGKDVDGKDIKLSDYRGKIVVLDFWGRW